MGTLHPRIHRSLDSSAPAILIGTLVGTFAALSACGGNNPTSTWSETGGTPNQGGEKDVVPSAGGQGGTYTSVGFGGNTEFETYPEDGGGGDESTQIEPDAACATEQAEATLTPVNIFLQFDRSTSMNEKEKWPQAAAALTSFFQDGANAGIRIALRFFPSDKPVAGCTGTGAGVGPGPGPGGGAGGSTGETCNIDACSEPFVPLGELTADPAPDDAQEDKLVKAIEANAPSTTSEGTPLSAALAGALKWAAANQSDHPEEKTVVVLVTDGQPTSCDQNSTRIAALAANALATDKVPTYTISMEGADVNLMNDIAKKGGTKGINVASDGAQQALVDAFKAIRGNAVSCDLAMPKGKAVDKDKINVTFTPGEGEKEQLWKVGVESDCKDGAWYYDDPAAPKKITLCPETCQRVQADAKARLDVILGCVVVTKPPQ